MGSGVTKNLKPLLITHKNRGKLTVLFKPVAKVLELTVNPGKNKPFPLFLAKVTRKHLTSRFPLVHFQGLSIFQFDFDHC